MLRVCRTIYCGIPLLFEWHGGAYVDVCKAGKPPAEVINVWDDEKNAARLPFTLDSLEAIADDWIAGYGEHGPIDLAHDVKTHWYV